MSVLTEAEIINMMREEYERKLQRFLTEAHHESEDDHDSKDDANKAKGPVKVNILDLGIESKLKQHPSKKSDDDSNLLYTVVKFLDAQGNQIDSSSDPNKRHAVVLRGYDLPEKGATGRDASIPGREDLDRSPGDVKDFEVSRDELAQRYTVDT